LMEELNFIFVLKWEVVTGRCCGGFGLVFWHAWCLGGLADYSLCLWSIYYQAAAEQCLLGFVRRPANDWMKQEGSRNRRKQLAAAGKQFLHLHAIMWNWICVPVSPSMVCCGVIVELFAL
jgi:hypothetical protein